MLSDRLIICITPHIRINLLTFPVIAASLFFGYFRLFAASYICAVLHELTHILTAHRLGIKISYAELHPFGICARLNSEVIRHPLREIAIAVSGPLCNLCLAATGVILGSGDYFIHCNIAMAVINLMPILPLDGGRILRAALSIFTGAVAAYSTTVRISRIPLALIFITSVYGIMTSGFNFSLILIGAFLLSNFFAEQHNISRTAVREMLFYKDKIPPDELSSAVTLCASSSATAGKILRRLSYSRYHIIYVTDNNMKVIKTLTEGQLIEAIIAHGIRITLGEI